MFVAEVVAGLINSAIKLRVIFLSMFVLYKLTLSCENDS